MKLKNKVTMYPTFVFLREIPEEKQQQHTLLQNSKWKISPVKYDFVSQGISGP